MMRAKANGPMAVFRAYFAFIRDYLAVVIRELFVSCEPLRNFWGGKIARSFKIGRAPPGNPPFFSSHPGGNDSAHLVDTEPLFRPDLWVLASAEVVKRSHAVGLNCGQRLFVEAVANEFAKLHHHFVAD